jgi:hypothetical protein
MSEKLLLANDLGSFSVVVCLARSQFGLRMRSLRRHSLQRG